MDDLDSLLEGELASINEMFHEFEIKDKQTERRVRTEEEELKKMVTKVRGKKEMGEGGKGGGRGREGERG